MYLSIPNFLTMIFTMCAICYILFSLYVKVKNSLDSYFYLALCVTIALWSFAKGIMYSVLTAEKASIWYVISLVGIVLFTSVLLHYLLMKAFKKSIVLLNKFSFIIYTPSIIIILIIVVNTFINPNYYQMFNSYWGWARTSTMLFNDIVSQIYFGICTVLSLIFIHRWKTIIGNKVEKNCLSTVTNLFWIIAIVTSVLRYLYYVLGFNVPIDLGPILLLIPTSTGIYFIEKRNHHENIDRQMGSEVISTEMKVLLYKYFAVAFILGGIIAFVFEHIISGKNAFYSIGFGFIIVLNGLVLKTVLGSNLALYIKDTFVAFCMSLFVPFLLFFTLVEGGGTVWPAPMIIIVAFMLYNNSRMIISITVSTIMSYVVIGIIVPFSDVNINAIDHILRIFLTIFLFAFAFTVNRFYLSTLNENKRQVYDRKFINDVTSVLVKTNYDKFQNCFESVLNMIGDHFQIEQVYFFSVNDTESEMAFKYGWSENGVHNMDPIYSNVRFENMSWFFNQIKDDGSIMINDTSQITEQDIIEKTLFDQIGIQSFYGASVYSNSRMIGYLGMDSISHQMNLDDNSTYILKTLGNVLCDAISRNDAEEKIRKMAYHDHLTGLPNRANYFDKLEEIMKISHRQHHGILIGLIDLDNFKTINDTFGHDGGDLLLQLVAKRLLVNVRDTDMVSRFGGDEFLLYFLGVDDESSARLIGQEILDKFKQPFDIKGQELIVTFSLGLYLSLDGNSKTSNAITMADKAMYNAKKAGKNRYKLNISDLSKPI